jgi:hypothetical protein
MKTKYVALIMGILLVGCSAPAAATELVLPTEIPPAATDTPVPPTTTPTIVPTTANPQANSSEDSNVWDLVYISDSTGMGVADEYADRIE